MILCIVAAILSLLILKSLGIFKGNMSGVRNIAIAAVLFVLLRGILKIVAPLFILAFAAVMFDCILWAGVHVFCHHEYTLATWRFFRSVFLGMPF